MIRDLSQDLSGGVESRHVRKHVTVPRADETRINCDSDGLVSASKDVSSDDGLAADVVLKASISGSSAPPAQNLFPVERDSSARAAKQSQPKSESHDQGKFARGGRKHLPAGVRSKMSKLNSRVRILRKALTRTDNLDCFHLYWKAILCAEFDLQELLA